MVRPKLQIVGHLDHSDFSEVAQLLRKDALLVEHAPELVVVAQSRPGEVNRRDIEPIRRQAPLAGIVALLGSWCEGETRTGRPWPGVERLYWYEFPAWWRRQFELLRAGRCPDWARPGNGGVRSAECGLRSATSPHGGLIAMRVARRETAEVLSDLFQGVGYATVWQSPALRLPVVHGVAAGIWVGGQLNDQEAEDLDKFCRQMARDAAPVVALLDFPRRDCVDRALKVGAATVFGMPWSNADLVATIQSLTDVRKLNRAA